MKYKVKLLLIVIVLPYFLLRSDPVIAEDSVHVKPSYFLKVTGQNLRAPNEFVFEIRIKHTNPDSTVFNYAGGQYFFNFNNAIANGGTLSYGYVTGVTGDSSDLPVNFRPRSPMVFDNGNGTSQLRLAVNTFPGPGNGYVIPNNLNGIKVCKMKITTTSSSFLEGVEIGLAWRDSLPGPYTKILHTH